MLGWRSTSNPMKPFGNKKIIIDPFHFLEMILFLFDGVRCVCVRACGNYVWMKFFHKFDQFCIICLSIKSESMENVMANGRDTYNNIGHCDC